jgi:hypothetical protein
MLWGLGCQIHGCWVAGAQGHCGLCTASECVTANRQGTKAAGASCIADSSPLFLFTGLAGLQRGLVAVCLAVMRQVETACQVLWVVACNTLFLTVRLSNGMVPPPPPKNREGGSTCVPCGEGGGGAQDCWAWSCCVHIKPSAISSASHTPQLNRCQLSTELDVL